MKNSRTVLRKIRILWVVTLTAFLTACAGISSQRESRAAAMADLERQKAEIAVQQADLARRETALAQQEQQLQSRLSEAAEAEAPQASRAAETSLPGPPDAQAGECYAQVIVPAKFNAVTEKVMKREASRRFETVPATFETITERVKVQDESTRLEVVPAEYETIIEQVEIRPATKKIIEVPAEYETVTERVMVEPARKEWKYLAELEVSSGQAAASPARMVERFGDYKVLDTRVEDVGVMCLIEIPATYKTIEKRVIKTPATTREEIIPAEYVTVERVVEKTPATTRKITIPAEFKTVERTVMKTPTEIREIVIPAEFEERTLQEKVSDASIQWRPVLCQVNMTRANVSALQSALKANGFGRRCDIDGIMGPCTMTAAQRYAIANSLSWGRNYVTLDVIRELGLDLGGNGESVTD